LYLCEGVIESEGITHQVEEKSQEEITESREGIVFASGMFIHLYHESPAVPGYIGEISAYGIREIHHRLFPSRVQSNVILKISIIINCIDKAVDTGCRFRQHSF